MRAWPGARVYGNGETITAEAWTTKEAPPRDFLMGTALSSTSSDFGVGRTLFAMALAIGIAANRQILMWGV